MKWISQGKTLVLTEAEWVKCPYCKQKTRTKAFSDTVLLNFPLYCPKCKRETKVSLLNMKLYQNTRYGANGSGKSTISRAFQTLTQEANSDISARVLDANENEIALSC